MRPDLFCRAETEVGESPLWDETRHCLWWVDLLKGELHACHPGGQDQRHASLEQSLGFVVPFNQEAFVAATGDSVGILTLSDGTYAPKTALERARPAYRSNDGKCDPRGRLWLGTMSDEHWKDGRWYRFSGDDELFEWSGAADLPNGLCWSLDGTRIYLADSGRSVVETWSYDLETGLPGSLLATLALPPAEGRPDGMTIDAEGHLWVALWGGGEVRRYRPDGTLTMQVRLPVTLAASCAFGGENHDLLFITTARYKLDADQLTREPLAGSVFVCRPGPTGMAASRFEPGQP